MNNKKSFKPQTLRAILYVVLTLVILGGAGIFYVSLQELRKYAVEVNHTIADAQASGNQVQALQSLKSQLTQSEALIGKANQMFSTPAAYQTQAISDIRNYAAASGVSIARTSFEEETVANSRTMTVSLQSPVSYANLIKFLDGIEGNIPKMQVSSIGISRITGGGSSTVNVDDIKITIAVR